ncbi:unnamed protein product [Heligmosomoides polygyrus]|uniref:Protein tweety homolog n=1 Tax=Heligmosomoides polygyrus TaxID=6339 RepID=A0A3P7ZHK6_HELPZ|nr:unnamed protein product [Heligmosomoides polygyrus]
MMRMFAEILLFFLQFGYQFAFGVGFSWMLLVTLLSIMLCVLFAGVISFCRQSKKGAVVFSGLGIVIFLVVWTLFCLVLPLTVAVVDFCSSGGDYIRSKISEPMLNAMKFYKTCDPRPTHDYVPSILGASNISGILTAFQMNRTRLDSLLDATFRGDVMISNSSALVADDTIRALKGIGALESSLACYAYRESVQAMHNGICNQAIFGLTTRILYFAFSFHLIHVNSQRVLFPASPSSYITVATVVARTRVPVGHAVELARFFLLIFM